MPGNQKDHCMMLMEGHTKLRCQFPAADWSSDSPKDS